MFVNIHDDYRPSGLSRTLPNLLTQEGVRGAEHAPGAAHETVLPFTRFLIGAADYTIPYYYEPAVGASTRTHQLALTVVFFSPLKFVLWYDSPASYKGEPEIELFGRVPTTWDETVVLHAVPGEAVALARRKGVEWYLGAITNGSARTLDLPLDFLPAGTTYRAHIYRDVAARQVGIETQEVTASSVLTATMLPSGGYAARLEPVN
jgi:alpha-glucosidase